jgi:hypothetical protein
MTWAIPEATMNKNSTANPIPEVQYPSEHLDDLKRMIPIAVDSVARDGLPLKSGSIDLGELDSNLDVAHFYLTWVTECNTVIDYLNLALHDLRALPQTFSLLGGSPWSRYALLVRLFFHEFYRLREIFSVVTSACVKRGYITKEERLQAREAFHAAIDEAVELRNSVVHGATNWTGREHFDLSLVSYAHDTGNRLVQQETGEELSVEAALEKLCAVKAGVLQQEGEKVVELMNLFIRGVVSVTAPNELREPKIVD